MSGRLVERLHRVWTTPVIGFVWLVNVVFEWRDRWVRALWERDRRDVELFKARKTAADLHTDIKHFGRQR